MRTCWAGQRRWPTSNSARIISPAQPPEDPSWPRKKVLVALAGVVGVALGVFLVVVLEVWRQLRARYSPAPVISESRVEPVETVMVEAAPVETVQVAETVQPVPRRRIVYTGSPKISTGYPKR